MAKRSMIERETRRINLIAKYRLRRNELKGTIKSSNDYDVISNAQMVLAKMPINSNPVRHNTRCQQCGRPRAVYKKFGLCRICLRRELMAGNIAGGRKSSW